MIFKGGRVVDTVRTRFGIRWFAIDPAEGFSLNGKYMKLQGVNLHSTYGPLGAVVDEDAIRQQLLKMKSMGVNAVRTSHNPPSPEFVRACEELGLLLMVEAFDTWHTPKRPNDYGRFFDANSDADITEMVQTNKNSPSVIMWSIGNEIPDGTSIEIGVPIARAGWSTTSSRSTGPGRSSSARTVTRASRRTAPHRTRSCGCSTASG